mmetsp:Transcript_37753/g.66438  ORF Transcript_37753/g.66438 Transcript_37753/m.66438 type:complete len:297 (-) Transcript_37753:124-1014(-)
MMNPGAPGMAPGNVGGPQGQNLARRGVTGASFQTDFTQMGSVSKQNIFGGAPTNVLDEEKRLIDKVFAIVDKDLSQSIDWKELEEMFKLFGVETHFLTSAIQRIMANVDSDHDGMISPTEFHKLLSQKFEPGDPASEMLDVFNRMDKKHDGKLDVDELHEVAVMLGEVDMDKDEIRRMIGNFIELHNKKPPQGGFGGPGGNAVSNQRGNQSGQEYTGRIVEKDKENFCIKCEALKAAEASSKGEVQLRKEDMRHFKVGDMVKFEVSRGGGNTFFPRNMRDPELQFDEFYTVMTEEL